MRRNLIFETKKMVKTETLEKASKFSGTIMCISPSNKHTMFVIFQVYDGNNNDISCLG